MEEVSNEYKMYELADKQKHVVFFDSTSSEIYWCYKMNVFESGMILIFSYRVLLFETFKYCQGLGDKLSEISEEEGTCA